MKINRVHLENYRVHENLDIEFSKGINLLLGQNGKGKSSILEAIGIALFDSKPRTTLGETVTFGKKSGKIEISFTGIDGEEYLIAKKIPNGSSKLSRVSDNLTIDDKGEKIKELCGIKGELKNIFDNIIVAKQNEFISAFKDSATNREAIFNSIFNTDIYKKIGEKDLLKVYQKYETQLGIENAKYETLNSKLLNPEELTQQLQLEEQKQKDFLLKIKTYSGEEKNIESQLKVITRLELEKEKLSGQYKTILNNITNYKTNEKKIDILIDESIQAEYILLENKEKYEEYNNISKLLDDKKNEQRKLSEKKKIYEDKERLKIKNQNLISQISGNINLCNNKIENCSISILEKQNTLDDLIYSIKEKEKYQLEYQNSIDLIGTLLQHSTNFENQLASQENELKNFSAHLSNKKVDLEMKQNTIIALEKENLVEQLEQLKIYEEKKNTLEKRNSILDTQREENLTAYNLLKSYQCPYLKENCENLKDKDINLFFTNKLSNIEKEREKNILEIKSISKELAKKSNIEESLYRLAIFKKEAENLELEILKDTEHNLALNTSLALIHSNYENFKLKNNFNSREELQNEYTALKIKLDNLNLNKDIEERKKLEVFISSLTKDMSKYQEEKSLLMIKMDRLESENLAIDEYLRANSHILTQFLDITKVIDKEEENLKSLESSKTLYLENYKKANEKENYLKEKEQIQKKLNSEQENCVILNKQIENNQLELNNFNKISLLDKQAEIKSLLGSFRENIGKIETQIEILSQKLIEISNDKTTLEKLARNIKKLKTKLELTQIFRTNVKDMGKEVAKNMLREIELMSTDNFRKITGRGEKIIWSNEDKDKYLVYLVGNDTQLKFEQLSGGEQVAVAISIRSAMSTIFTDSKFSIFDEPTNNLDREKKQSLADSIGEILKNLEQSIIVTHDDTFKEMSEKVIYL